MGWDRDDPANRPDLPHERRALEQDREDRLAEYAPAPRCALGPDSCGGPLEWHHPILQQRIRDRFRRGAWRPEFSDEVWQPVGKLGIPADVDAEMMTARDICGDTRNRIVLCDDHHDRLHNGRLEAELPEQVWKFAREFGLDAQLENDLARKRAA